MREVAAPPEIVFDVLTDHRRYPDTALRQAELEREGEPAPNGLGAIRVLTAVGPPMREEVIAYERAEPLLLHVLSGLPVRDHVGTVELEPREAGAPRSSTRCARADPARSAGPVVGRSKQAIRA